MHNWTCDHLKFSDVKTTRLAAQGGLAGGYVPRAEYSRLLIDGQIQFVYRGETLQSNDVTSVPVAKFTMP